MTEQVVVDGNGMTDDTTLASLEPQVLHIATMGNAAENVSSCPCVQYGCSRDCSCVSYSCPCVNYGCARDHVR